MTRISVVLSDTDSVHRLIESLLGHQVEEHNIYVLARESDSLKHLPIAFKYVGNDMVAGGGAVLCRACDNALHLISGILGENEAETSSRSLKEQIDRGCILLCIDAPDKHIMDVQRLLQRHVATPVPMYQDALVQRRATG